MNNDKYDLNINSNFSTDCGEILASDENLKITKSKYKHPVLFIQLVIALIFLITVFVFKFFFPNEYSKLLCYYEEEINKTIIQQQDNQNNTKIFISSDDEA